MSRRVDSQGRAFKGSQRQIQAYVNLYREHLSERVLEVLPELAALRPLRWVSPLRLEGYHEYRDKRFLAAIGQEALYSQLKAFWPRRGPDWDAIAVVNDLQNGQLKGVVLVEAKSYPREMYGPGSRAVADRSRAKITEAINQTKAWLGVSPSIDWMGHSYQFANRLAHLYFFRKYAPVPTWLVNVYFVRDPWSPKSPASRKEWEEALNKFKAEMGLTNIVVPFTADLFLDGIDTSESEQLLKRHREEILKVASKHGAHDLRIFGSVARGEAGPNSDIDVLVEFEPGHSLLDRIALMRELEELLGCKVDVVTEKALHQHIRDEVLRQAVPL